MKRRYAIHPGDYAIGENEKFYSDMAAKGWRLVKRGTHLSRFERFEPEKVLYRIELASPDLFEGTELPEDKLAIFEECGWEFVTSCGLINVFRTKEGSGAPEFYMEPEQQAMTLKGLRRSYLVGIISSLLIVAFYVLITASVGGYASLGNALDSAFVSLVEYTALIAFFTFFMIWGIYTTIYGAVRTGLLYRRLKKGRPLDHSPQKRRLAHKSVNVVCGVLCSLMLVMLLAQFVFEEKMPLPEISDGPYVTLKELGYTGWRDDPMGNEAQVIYSNSILAEHWDVNEYIEGEKNAWIYEDIYRLRIPEMADLFAKAIVANATFSESEDFREITVPGADWTRYTRLETVAVYGQYVIYITYSPEPYSDDNISAAIKAVEAILDNIKRLQT